MSLDDGKTKPTPRPDEKKTSQKSKQSKPRSESTSSHHGDPEFMCLIRAVYRSEKITTVVSSRTFSTMPLLMKLDLKD